MRRGQLVTHKGGIPWHEAPKPFWLHRCRAQTTGTDLSLTGVERCACGAIRFFGAHNTRWMERNSRR